MPGTGSRTSSYGQTGVRVAWSDPGFIRLLWTLGKNVVGDRMPSEWYCCA